MMDRYYTNLSLNLNILNAGFSALRVYALSDGKYVTTGTVLVLNLVPFATNMVSKTITAKQKRDIIEGRSSTL